MSEAAVHQEIYSLLVPLSEHRLLVPRANVAEVTGLREIRSEQGAPPWLLGTMTFEGQPVPLMSLECVMGGRVPDIAPRTRVLLLRTLTDALGQPYYGILTQGFPQLVRVNAMVLEADDSSSWPADGPVLCQVKMVNQRPLVPDLERLEAMIAAGMPAAHAEG